MAETTGCEACEGQRPHTWIITHLSPVSTIYSCEEDASINLLMILASLNGVDFMKLYAAMEAVVYPDDADLELVPKKRPHKAAAKPAPNIVAADETPEELADAVSEG